jgi:RNA polymerase sigma-70 factor (ECF subfamily)
MVSILPNGSFLVLVLNFRMPNLNQRELIESAIAGDHQAFRVIVEAFQGFVYSIAFRFTGNTDDAEDLTQEAFIRLWKNLNRFDPQREMKKWLGKIISNLCLDYLKSARKKKESKMSADELFKAVETSTPEKEMVATEIHSIVVALAGRLTPKQRAVFILRDLEMLEVSEVCEMLGMSASHVKSNLYYARTQMKSDLMKYFNVQKNEMQGL